MPVLISETTLEQSSNDILNDNYYQKLNVTVTKGRTSCAQKKRLLEFMVMQVVVNQGIPVTSGDCNCMKQEFNFDQICE